MGFKWQDFYVEIDANDPFFATIMASVAVNADFDQYGINSVDVHCEYTKTQPGDDQGLPLHQAGRHRQVRFGHQQRRHALGLLVRGQLQGPEPSLPGAAGHDRQGQITINANDLGILYVDLAIGNVDFTKTPQVQVAITYPETDANGQPVSQQFNFDKDKKTDRMLAVLLKPVDKAYKYQTTYIMADGTQMVTDWMQSQSSQLFINSPFVVHTFSFLAEGDFIASIDNIFLKMAYADAANKLEQDTEYTFTAQNRQNDWTIPIVAERQGPDHLFGRNQLQEPHHRRTFRRRPTTPT